MLFFIIKKKNPKIIPIIPIMIFMYFLAKIFLMTREHKQILKQSTILIVDDNEALRNELKDLLEIYILESYEASDGVEAYEVFKEKNPTMIFSDIKMPNVNGIDLVQKIRRENNEIPIALISAHSDKELLFEALKLNLVDYLVKPVLLEDLKTLLVKFSEKIDKNSLLNIKLSETLFFSKKEKVLYDEGITVPLTKNEQRLLMLFLSKENEVLEEDYIIYYIWKYEIKTISALRNLISRLRTKIGKETIESIHGQGYRFKRQL
jgi:DNA-binding response OmpR family regulator